MPKFRKIPAIIDAVQWFPGVAHPGVGGQPTVDGVGSMHYVTTIHEQRAYLVPGDWIAAEPVPDRYYPIKPEVFEKTYTPFNEHTQSVCSADDVRALMDAMGLFPSVIRSGEQWTPTCEAVKENAMAALGRIRSSLTN